MGLKWSGGDMFSVSAEIGARGAGGVAVVEKIVQEIVAEGAEVQRQELDKATTPTGRRRMRRGQGNTAGRNDTGYMIGDISYDVERSGRTIVGKWGWWLGYEPYYMEQEWGTAKIEPAHSLYKSFEKMIPKLVKRLEQVSK